MPGQSDPISENEIEELLREAQSGDRSRDGGAAEDATALDEHEIQALLAAGGAVASGAAQTKSAQHSSSKTNQRGKSADDAERLLDQAEQAIASVDDMSSVTADIEPFQLKDLTNAPASREQASLDLLRDVELDLKIELGRTYMHLDEVLKLQQGSVVSLDKLAGDPVDIYVNGRLIARGEVLVLNDNFCVRVAELVGGDAT